jgi:hypothetical protein
MAAASAADRESVLCGLECDGSRTEGENTLVCCFAVVQSERLHMHPHCKVRLKWPRKHLSQAKNVTCYSGKFEIRKLKRKAVTSSRHYSRQHNGWPCLAM